MIVELAARRVSPQSAGDRGRLPRPASSYINRFKGSPYVKGARHIMPARNARGRGFVPARGCWANWDVSTSAWQRKCCPIGQARRRPPRDPLCDRPLRNADPVFCPNRPPPPLSTTPAWRAREPLAKRKTRSARYRASSRGWRRASGRRSNLPGRTVSRYIADRVVFASDYRSGLRATLGEWVTALKQIVTRPIGEQRKLFRERHRILQLA